MLRKYLALCLSLCLSTVTMGVDCSKWQACDPKSRRILFILDASSSIGTTQFNTDLLDFVANTFCGFSNTNNGTIAYEAGVIVFNRYVETLIPFQQFTPDQFQDELDAKVRGKVVTSCCTSHAEAVRLARAMFTDPSLQGGMEEIAFIVTDGNPSPNLYDDVINDPRAKKFYDDFGVNLVDWTQFAPDGMSKQDKKVHYAADLLPNEVRRLLRENVRLFFIGVPSQNGREINTDYFTGAESTYCFEGVCKPIGYSPLVSRPPNEHAFSVNTWDIDPLVEKSLEKICAAWSPPDISVGVCDTLQPVPGNNANNCLLQNLATFALCCPESIDMSETADATCRQIVTGGAWCVPDGRSCSRFTHQDVLNIYIDFDSNNAQDSCCKQCQVFGDPRGVAFDGREDDWVLCDGRDATHCLVSKDICSTKTDHTGGTCIWSETREKRIRHHLPDISTYGSPCHPDFTNFRPSMVVYSADDFSASVEMSERGTIYSITLEITEGTYKMVAEDCMKYAVRNPEAAWGGNAIPSTFFVKDWWKNGRTNEVIWQLGDQVTGILLEVVCVQDASILNGNKDKARLNIRNVVEMNSERLNPGGFCHTGVIQEADDSAASPVDPDVLQSCMVNQPARLCKALTNPSCNDAEMDAYIDQWCERMQGERVRVKTCKRTIKNSKYPIAMWRRVYCSYAYDMGITGDIGSCMHQMAENPEQTVAAHGPFTVSGEYCATDVDDYTPRSEQQQCQHGVSVGFENDDGRFREVFFIPENYPPCNGKLVVRGSSKYKNLFNRQLIFRQCDAKPSCPMADRCKRIAELSISIQYENCNV